jgi:hypothetical protein
MHLTTAGSGGGDGVERGALDGSVVVFGNDESGHDGFLSCGDVTPAQAGVQGLG